ncbi:MAG: hypothetical protein R3F59_33120 [Myxococcota bacterium]
MRWLPALRVQAHAAIDAGQLDPARTEVTVAGRPLKLLGSSCTARVSTRTAASCST